MGLMIAAPAGQTQRQNPRCHDPRQGLLKIRALLLGHLYKGVAGQVGMGAFRKRIEVADNSRGPVTEGQSRIRAAIRGHEQRSNA